MADPSFSQYLQAYGAVPLSQRLGLTQPQPPDSQLAAAVQRNFGDIAYAAPQLGQAAGLISPQTAAGLNTRLAANEQAVNAKAPSTPGLSDWWSGKVGFGKFLLDNLKASAPAVAEIGGGAAAGAAAGAGFLGIGAVPGAIIGGALGAAPSVAGAYVRAATKGGSQALTDEQAKRIAIATPFASLAQGALGEVLPGVGGGILNTAGKGLLRRALTGAGEGAAVAGVGAAGTEAGQRYIDEKPLTDKEAFKDYALSAATAAFVGAPLGALGGMVKRHPSTISNDDISATVDQEVQAPAPTAPLALPAPAAFTDAAGRTVVGSEGIDTLNAIPRPSPPAPEPAAALPAGLPRPGDLAFAQEPTGLRGFEEPQAQAANLLQTYPDDQLHAFAATLDERGSPAADLVRAEIARREAEAQQTPEAQQAQRIQSVQDRAAEIYGRKTQFTKSLTHEDEAGLVDQLHDEIEKTNPPKTAIALAEHYGLIDDNFKPRDLPAEIEAAKAVNDTAKVDDLTAKQALIDEAQARRAARTAPEEPVVEPVAEAAPEAPAPVEEAPVAPPAPAPEPVPVPAPVSDLTPEQLRQQRIATLIDQHFDVNNEPEKVVALRKLADTNPELAESALTTLGRDAADLVAPREEAPVSAEATPADIYAEGAGAEPGFKLAPERQTELRSRLDNAVKNGMDPSDRAALMRNLRTATSDKDVARIEREISAHERTVKPEPIAKVAPEVTLGPSKASVELKAKPEPKPAKTQAEAKARPTKPPKWATTHADDLNGEVAYHDPDVALVRAQSALSGRPVYTAVDKATGARTKVDIRSFTGQLFPADVKQRLVDQATRLEGEDRAAQAAAPHGPFISKAGQVAKSATMNPRWAGYATALMKQLGLKDARVFLFHPEDLKGARDAYHLNGDYHAALSAGMDAHEDGSMRQFGPGRNDFYIAVRKGLSEGRAVETIAHEVGHIVEKVAFQSAPDKVKAAIHDEYQQWLASTKGLSPAEIVRSLRPPETGLAHSAGLSDDVRLNDRYWRSFGEWFADNTAKWAITSEKPIGLVNRFFAAVADKIKALVAKVYGGKDVVPAAMGQFLSGMREDASKVWLKDRRDNQRAVASDEAAQASAAPAGTPSTAESNARAKQFADAATRVGDVLTAQLGGPHTLMAKVREVALKASTLFHIVEHNAAKFEVRNADGSVTNGLRGVQAATDLSRLVKDRLSKISTKAIDDMHALRGKSAEALNFLMQMSEREIDPEKKWDAHTWLHGLANEAALKATHQKGVEAANLLKANGEYGAYQAAKATNEMSLLSAMSTRMHQLVASDRNLPPGAVRGFDVDPMQRFLANSTLHDTPQAGRAYFRQVVDAQMAGIREFVTAAKERREVLEAAEESAPSRRSMSDAEKAAQNARRNELGSLTRRLPALEEQLRTNAAILDHTDRAPYFSLGRQGQHYVRFAMAPEGDTNNVSQAALDTVADAVEKAGFTGVQLSRDNLHTNVFARFKDVDTQARFAQLVQGLIKDGHVQEGSLESGTNPSVFEERSSNAGLNRVIENIEADERLSPSLKQVLVDNARKAWVDGLPGDVNAKFLVKRDNVPGYDPNMVRNFAARLQAAHYALAGQVSGTSMARAFGDMRDAYSKVTADPTVDPQTRVGMQQVIDELAAREQLRSVDMSAPLLDRLRATAHSYYLGLSPSYMLVNMSQLGTNLWPELAKTHGFMQSATSIARVTPMAFKIMKAAFAEGYASGGLKRASDASVTEAALVRAGVPEKTAAFVMKLANGGSLDIGAAARSLGRVARDEGDSNWNTALRLASTTALYSETMSRLVAALATHALEGDSDKAVAKAHSVLGNAMFTFDSANTARAFGNKGFAGPLTPVIMQFMQFQAQMTEKMYRELDIAFLNKAASASEKTASRRFLAGHLAAMTVLAGSMGLPFASAAAFAYDKLKDEFGNGKGGPSDVRSAWRDYLDTTLGATGGEVASHGVFRAAGVDISQRIGEQDYLPFSKLLFDRRKFEDAAKDYALNSYGSAPGVVHNIVQGGVDIGRGDVLKGMIEAVPNFLKGPMRAYQMSRYGYINAQGNKIAMAPSTQDVLAQALGFTPADKATAQEAARAHADRNAELTLTSQTLKRQLATAIERGDQEGSQELFAKVSQFDAANPAYAVGPTLERTLKQRATARMLAAQGAPGTRVKDFAARGLTSYFHPQ